MIRGSAANIFVAGSSAYPINNVYFGKGITDAAPSGYTISGTSGAGSNIPGGSVTIAAGNGTGTGESGSINFQTASGGNSGTAVNAPATAMTISPAGNVGIGSTSPTAPLDVAGSISTGNGAILWKTYSGTTSASGNSTSFAHGLTASKILTMTCTVFYNNNAYYQFSATSYNANTRFLYWDGTNAYIVYNDGDSNWYSKAYRCVAQYVP